MEVKPLSGLLYEIHLTINNGVLTEEKMGHYKYPSGIRFELVGITKTYWYTGKFLALTTSIFCITPIKICRTPKKE